MKKSNILWIFIFILIIINLLGYLLPWGNENSLKSFSDILPLVCSGISVICLFFAFRGFIKFDYTKASWLMILIGIFMFFLGELLYGILEIILNYNMNEVFPTIADLFWCLGYIPLLIGLLMMFSGYKKSGLPIEHTKFYILFSILFFLLSTVVIYYLLIPIIKDEETSLIAKITYLFYPLGDLLLVIPTIILMFITNLYGGSLISKSWRYLAIGFMLITLADLFFAYLGWKDLYNSGNLLDIVWNVGYLMVGLAALYQRELIDSLIKK